MWLELFTAIIDRAFQLELHEDELKALLGSAPGEPSAGEAVSKA